MLLPLTAAFIAGLLVGSFLPYIPVTGLLLLLCGGVVFTVLERKGAITGPHSVVLYGGILCGVVLWTVAASQTTSKLLQAAGPDPVRIAGTIVEPVKHAPGRAILVVQVSQLKAGPQAEPMSGRVRLTWREPDRTFPQGSHVELTARLYAPSGILNPGGFDYGASLQRKGIDAVASVSGPGAVAKTDATPSPLDRWHLLGRVDAWRDQIRRAALATLSGPAPGLYVGMIIGESGYVGSDLRDAFMATGTVHILSISGSHLGLIALLSFILIRWAWRHLPPAWLLTLSRRITPTRLAAIMTVVPVSFYTLLAGSEVATVRSLIMIVLFLVAIWLGRIRDLLLTLAGAALLILLHDPRALFDISFQLSYLSVLAIALVVKWRISAPSPLSSPPGRGRGEGEGVVSRSGEWLRNYLWLTAGVTLATMPLVAYYFNQMPWLGLGANLLVVPFAGFVLVPLGLLAAVSVLMTGSSVLPGGWLIQQVFDLFSAVVALLAKIPGAEWHVASPTILSMGLFYALLFGAIRSPHPSPPLYKGRLGGVERQAADPTSPSPPYKGGDPRGRFVRRASLVGVALLLGWWSWSPRMLDGQSLRVTFLDVGQGDAAVIELPDGKTILIDGGAAYDVLDMGRAVVGPYLWDRGIRRLDHVIGTHPQLDHVGGLAWVVRAFEVGRYWGNGITREEPFYRRLQDALHEHGIVEERIEAGQILLSSGPCRLQAYNPPVESPDRQPGIVPFGPVASGGSVLNNLSVVTRLDCGLHSFLFTADVETEALSRLRALSGSAPVRVLKVPHHGSRSSLDEAWIQHVQPETGVISVGSRNSYGHPAGVVLAAYNDARVRLFRTDQDGAVWIIAKLSSPDMAIFSARGILPRRIAMSSWSPRREFLNLSRLWRNWAASS